MQIQVDINQRELKEHGTFSYPVLVSREILSDYERSSFFWHWHREIELTLILDGDICYQVGGQTYQLKAGDGLFCNSNIPHTGRRNESKDCLYMSLTFDPKIIYGFESSLLQTKYVTPLTLNTALPAIVFPAGSPGVSGFASPSDSFGFSGPSGSACPWHQTVLGHLQTIWDLTGKRHENELYEFQLQILLSQIWLLLYEHMPDQNTTSFAIIRERERILAILSYLHRHYMDKVTLADIAAKVNICPSECCRFFKRNMKQSIFDYLLRYRLEKSLSLLLSTNESITDIALKTGFPSPSYFSKVFSQEMNCSPREYRKCGIDTYKNKPFFE